MPRLDKIRITGNKYDGFKIKHEDSIFNLASDHTLFTLQNGSGKGVMLQLISQIMLPGTAWGSNNGNKIEGMFYDRYHVFKPYTFHVVLEWDLESRPGRRLLAGICISARWQERLDDSEGKVGLKYFLYTHEYSSSSRFSLGNLPLYSKSGGGVQDYEQLESFIDENHRDFRKYSKTSVSSLNSDYYRYLASHGIYRYEWEIMKTINRSEGGLNNYFSRAHDNQALFDKLIIPAVSESISSRSQENDGSLYNMFVDNIKIAKNLPELISRTEDINQLLKMVEPLVIDSEHGLKLKNTGRMIRERGNNYIQALERRTVFLNNEYNRTKIDREKTENRIGELEYEKQNLKYARKIRELRAMETEKKENEEKLQQLTNKLKELETRQQNIQLNLLHLEYMNYQQQYNKKMDRINALKESSELSNLRNEISSFKQKIKDCWPEMQANWEESCQEAAGYLQYLKIEEKRLEQEETNISCDIRGKELKIANFEEKENKFERQQKELSSRFNPLQLSTPLYMLEQMAGKLENEEKRLNELKGERDSQQNKIVNLQEEIKGLQIDLARRESKYQSVEQTYQIRNNREKEVIASILSLLELDKFKEVYSQTWLQGKQMELEKILSEKVTRLQELNNKAHELELDLALNDGNCWIANNDQKRYYQLIKKMDIQVYLGSDFLLNITDNREKYLQKFPLLPYGLVLMYESNWEKVKNNLQDNDIFRAPVPIYINYLLQETEIGDSFKLVHGGEIELINNPARYRDWCNSLDQQQREIGNTIAAVERKSKNIRQVIFMAGELLEKESSSELQEQLTKITGSIEQLQEKIDNRYKKIRNQQEKLTTLEDKINEKVDKIVNLKQDYRVIEDYVDRFNELEKLRPEIKNIKEKLTSLEERLNINKFDRHQNTRLQLKLENDYQNWQKDLQRFLAELSEVIPDIDFKVAELKEVETEKLQHNFPHLYDYREAGVNYYYQQLLDLERKEEDKNAEIKYLRKDLNRLTDQILKEEEKMKKIDAQWQSYSFQDASEQELQFELKKTGDQIQLLDTNNDQLKHNDGVLTGEIKEKRKEISEIGAEIQERFQKTAQTWLELDLNEKELLINSSLEENREYSQKLDKMLEDYSDKISHLKILNNKLEQYELKPDKGEINSQIEEEIRANPEDMVEKWVRDYQEFRQKLKELKDKTEEDFYQFKSNVEELVRNKILKNRIQEKIIQGFRSEAYAYNQEMLTSFREYLFNELSRLDNDKTEAERARNQWAERSAIHVIRIITALQEMINNMVYHNESGYAFPLVRLKRKDFLPEREEEIIPELKEYFVDIIERFNREDINVERLTKSELADYTGDSALFSRAVRGRYPVLEVYKMSERNEFKYFKPEDYFYADWESVIQGKGDTPEGSGGQSLSINAFMIMMLVNYKKQKLDQTNPWTVLFLDNPFGKASAAHVLDPVFEIADKLNFQIVAFAAPEIIKTEISERFPVFWALEIKDDEKGRGVVQGQVIYGARLRKTGKTV